MASQNFSEKSNFSKLFRNAYSDLMENIYPFDTAFRGWCETAVENVGLNFHSDILWERYIEWEHERRNLIFITEIFRRLITIPTKLYNKHWDNFIAHVRDHHPRDILDYKDYDELRRITCKELGNFILLNICNNIIKSGEKVVKF